MFCFTLRRRCTPWNQNHACTGPDLSVSKVAAHSFSRSSQCSSSHSREISTTTTAGISRACCKSAQIQQNVETVEHVQAHISVGHVRFTCVASDLSCPVCFDHAGWDVILFCDSESSLGLQSNKQTNKETVCVCVRVCVHVCRSVWRGPR